MSGLHQQAAPWYRERIADAAMLIIGAAGVAKCFDVSAFAASLETWTLLPAWSIPGLAIGVPTLEMLIAGLWFASSRARLLAIAAAALVGVFTAAYVAHLAIGVAPDCACLGKHLAFEASKQGAGWMIIRNALLLIAVLQSSFLPRRRVMRVRRTPGVRPDAAAGFTIIEILFVIVIIAVIIAMLVPQLGLMHERGRKVRELSDLGSHAAVMTMYTTDWRESYPFFAAPEQGVRFFEGPDGPVEVDRHFYAPHLWRLALANHYYDGQATQESLGESFLYPSVFVSRPEFWRPETRTGPEQWRAVSAADVGFPAQKGVLFSLGLTAHSYPLVARSTRFGVAFVDGSADRMAAEETLGYYPGGDGGWYGSVYLVGTPVMHTLDGVRGLDFPR